ncbi:lytic polysaccharide monooxygenase [Melanomma pulvis-pyrius CBS 109.77]|uniref:lytic cellulose monooxygenase (C4-dehydrogenating) n=1 Tax=Melanomma pulvis-pyrius CBS 109.77 TaxID=1314802 RepID=A0A6A6XUM8_9PLEO|nr:lytic polysaccharide monooxygenase [Melanomma pulvis-pyrius CBS 109.77]
MKSSMLFILGATFLGHVNGHYTFGRFIFDSKWSKTWEYVRQISPDKTIKDADIAFVAPNTEPASLDLRCGRNASIAWSRPNTATIKAGDTVGFAAGEPRLTGTDVARIYHPGFASAWLSKSPTDDLNLYTGDGDWFKILSVTGRTEQSLDFSAPENKKLYDQFKAIWGTFNVQSWNFTVPKTTPPGKYLLRFEHIFPNPQDSQFYVNCAHVDIVNTNSNFGTPAPLVKIPGIYTRGQKDVYFDHFDLNFNVTQFVAPKPVVWTG